MRRSRLLVVLILVLAGCAGTTPPADSPTTAADAADSGRATPPSEVDPTPATSTTTVGRTSTAPPRTASAVPKTSIESPETTASQTATVTAERVDNPWGNNPVVVSVENEAGYAHQKYGQFERALDYWEENGEQYAGYDVTFTLEPDATSPDVTIRYVESIERCGDSTTPGNALGCAPLYQSGQVDPHTVVQIRESEDDVQLVETTKHEFAHVLGIGHGEEPMPLMADDDLYLRASPWNRSHVTYYLDFDDKPGVSEETLQGEVEHALRYFETGANGNLETVPSFERVDRRGEANVVVEFHDDPRSGDSFEGSTVTDVYEGDVEGEFYRRYTIALYDLDTSAMGWHVAYQLARSLVADRGSYPSALDPDECGYQCRRDDWWA